jgi:hypothetical protein
MYFCVFAQCAVEIIGNCIYINADGDRAAGLND